MTPHDNAPPGVASRGAPACSWWCSPRHISSLWDFRVLLLVAAITLISEGNAQTPGISGVNVIFQRVSEEQGLSNNTVWAITQDKQGFIWIGTSDGLNRFDGKRCIVYHAAQDSSGLSDSWVWSIFSDRDSTLWIGTNRGLNRFDPRTLTFKKYLHDPAIPTTLSHNEVHAIYRDRAGELWAGTKHGLNRFDARTETWTRYFPNPDDLTRPGDNFINAIFEDNDGIFWIEANNYAMRGGGIFSFDRERGTFIRIDARSKEDYSSGFIASAVDDIPGNLWVCSSDRYGPEPSDQWTGVTRSLSLQKSDGKVASPQHTMKRGTTYRLYRVCEDRHGAVWGTEGRNWGGLVRYEIRANHKTGYAGDLDTPSSLSSPHINVVFVDRSGLLWIGTSDEGVNSASTKPFLFRHTVGDSPKITMSDCFTFVDSRGDLWLGPLRFSASTQRARYVLGNAGVIYLCQDEEGTIWTCDSYGLAKYVPRLDNIRRVWRLPHAGLDEVATLVFVDSRDIFWIGTQGGVYRLKKDLSTYARFNLDTERTGGILGGRVTSIYEDKLGSVWVGTMTGLYQFQNGGDSTRRFVHFDGDSTSLSSNICTGVLEDALGRLWVSSSEGLDKFVPTRSAFDRHLHRPVGRIVADRRGRFWFGTADRLHGPVGSISMFDPAIEHFQSFDVSDGLPNQVVFGWPHAMLKSGELVFGTNKGIVVFQPDSVKLLEFVPPVFITGITLFEKALPLQTSSELLRELSLGYEEDVFTIEFAALSYDMPEHNQYAYRLEGFDKEWIYCGNRQEATYTNLDPGRYTFHVKGSNHDGVWNEAGASLAIVIRPAYWQTWWFRSLGALGILGIAFALYRQKLTRLQREQRAQEGFSRQQIVFQEAERKRIAAELHDGLGQDLLIAANEIQEGLNEAGPSNKRMQDIASLIAGSLRSAREIASNLHPHQLDRLGLSAAVEGLARTIAKSCSIPVECTCAEVDGLLSREAELHLYRIIQEALSNAVRHAAAKDVRVIVVRSDGVLRAVISDDGIGFDPVEFTRRTAPDSSGDVARGFGLASMAERAKITGGALTIHSARGSGTTVIVAVPYGHTHTDTDR